MDKSQRIEKLLRKWAYYDAMSRYLPFEKNLKYLDYTLKKLEVEKRIRKILFGESDLLKLAKEWKII